MHFGCYLLRVFITSRIGQTMRWCDIEADEELVELPVEPAGAHTEVRAELNLSALLPGEAIRPLSGRTSRALFLR